MAVPKKRTSKMKKNLRKSVWRKQTQAQALKALSLGKSLLNQPLSDDADTFKGFKASSTVVSSESSETEQSLEGNSPSQD